MNNSKPAKPVLAKQTLPKSVSHTTEVSDILVLTPEIVLRILDSEQEQ